ncbi:hypothetical protein BTW01_13670 [Bacillus sp. SKDU12]|nr:hypothetical protein BTW01_13670 [Bacillus sp. SKDU12]
MKRASGFLRELIEKINLLKKGGNPLFFFFNRFNKVLIFVKLVECAGHDKKLYLLFICYKIRMRIK